MKKLALSVAAFIAAAPLVLASGSAFAATTYTPVLVKQFNTAGDSNFEVDSIVPVNDSVAVVELNNNDIWLTDGTTAGTTELETRAAAAGLEDWDFWNAKWNNTVVSDGAGKIYFWGYGIADDEWNIWSFDGTAFDQVTTAGFNTWSSLYFLGGELYAWGRTLASSVGYISLNHIETSNGVVDEIIGGNDCDGVNDNSDGVVFVNGRIIFNNDEIDDCDYRLLSWDPANPATAPVDLGAATDAVADGFDDWESRGIFEGELYFSGFHDTLGYELWATNGTVAGTRLVKDINTTVSDGSYSGDNSDLWFTEFAGELYFAAYDGSDTRLWKTNGTTGGTVVVGDIHDPNSDIEYSAVVLNGKMYFESDEEFYAFDGTTSTQLTDGSNDICWNYCAVAVAFDSHVFFVNYDGTNNSVWVTDGTTAGTYEVTNFGDESAIADSTDFSLVAVGSRLVFPVADSAADGGTDELALYSVGGAALADTGANVDGLALAGLFAVVAGAGVYAMRRRANA